MAVGQKHHYLPVFYLKQWAGPDRRLCEFSRPHKVVKPSATRGTSGGPLLARRADHWEAVGINIAVTASANIALPVTALPEAP